MRNINNRLRKNYRILNHINEEGKTKISQQKLLSLGFDFSFITQIITYKTALNIGLFTIRATRSWKKTGFCW